MKLIYRSILVVIICLSVANFVVAQSPINGGSIVVEPSPNVLNGLTAQGTDMVNMHTGSLNYGMDLLTLPSRQLSLPIRLQYNSNNVKVNTVASQVGLGWSLSAGGSIGRVMHGIPDEYDGDWLSPYESEEVWIPAKGYLNLDGPYADKDYYLALDPEANAELRRNIIDYSNKTGPIRGTNLTEVWDTEPDEFYFNMMGISGKFVFDKDGEPAIIPHQNLEIETFYGENLFGEGLKHIIGFEITDENGVKYTFGKYNDESHTPTDALEKTTLSVFTNRLHCGYFYNFGAFALEGYPNGGFSIYMHPLETKSQLVVGANSADPVGEVSNLTMSPHVSSWHLTSVTHPNGDWMDFEYDSGEDISYIASHDQQISQPNFSRYKTYEVINEQEYYVDEHQFYLEYQPNLESDDRPYQPQNVSITTDYILVNEKRVKNIINSAGHEVNFEYSERKDIHKGRKLDAISMINNEGLTVSNLEFKYHYNKSHIGSDQNVENYTYNIKGTNNNLLVISSLPIDDDWVDNMNIADSYRLILDEITENAAPKASFTYHSGTLPRRNSYQRDQWGGFNTNTKGHRLSNQSYRGHYYFENFWSSTTALHDQSFYDGTKLINFKIQSLNYFHNPLISAVANTTEGMANLSVNMERSKVGVLQTVNLPTQGQINFSLELNRVGESDDSSGTTKGGVRVSQVELISTVGESIIEEFDYKGGVLIPNIQLVDNRTEFESTQTSTINNIQFKVGVMYSQVFLSSSPMRRVMYEQGGAVVGYASVVHSIAGQGTTEYAFYNTNDDIRNESGKDYRIGLNGQEVADQYTSFGYPWTPFEDKSYLRGVLDKVTYWDNDDKVLKVEDYEYEVTSAGTRNKVVYGLKPGVHSEFNFSYERMPWYYAGFYKYQTQRMTLTEKIVTVYDNAALTDEDRFSQKTTFDYNNETTKLKSSTFELNDTDAIVTKYKYVDDLKDQITTGEDEISLAIKKLADNHINSLIEKSMYKSTDEVESAISAELTTYKEFTSGGSGINIYPNGIHKAEFLSPSSTFESVKIETNKFVKDDAYDPIPVLEFMEYDEFGNIKKQKTKDGIETAFTWDYENTLLKSMTANGFTTSYDHTPLVGVTKITDPNGQKTTYEYDELNRLKNIKDDNGDIVEHFRYNYGGQFDLNGKSFGLDDCIWPNKTDFIHAPSGLFVPYGEVEYVWDFGDDTVVETTENIIPEHSYAEDGIYTLSVTRTSGQFYGTQTISEEVVVNRESVKIKILAKTPAGQPHIYDVTLGANNSHAACNTIHSYAWYRSKNNGLTYEHIGSDPTVDIKAHQGLWIKLVTTIRDGSQSFTDEYVFNNYSFMGRLDLLAIQINPSLSCILAGQSVDFYTSEYVVVDGPIEMQWDFGDGTVITNDHAGPQAHSYASSRTYTVTLRIAYRVDGVDDYVTISQDVVVKDNDSGMATLTREMNIMDGKNGSTYQVFADVGLMHNINCMKRVDWYVDGVKVDYGDNGGLSLILGPNEDKFIVAKVVDGKNQVFETESMPVGDGAMMLDYMTQAELDAIDMTAAGSCNLKGQPLNFSIAGTLDLPNPTVITWNFGDGTGDFVHGSGPITHTFASSGLKNVKLTISNLLYEDREITKTINVKSNDGKTVRLIGEFTEGPHGGGEIDAQYSLDQSINCVSRYEWYVNGALISNNMADYGMLFQVNETKVVKVKVIDEAGNSFLSNEVTQGSPSFMTQAQFNAVSLNASSSCYVTGSNVSFSFSTPITLAGTSSVLWNFKDGSTINSGGFSGRSHSFGSTGTYNVSATISNPFYTNRTISKSVTISSPATYSVSHTFVEMIGATGLANFDVFATKTSGTACGNVRWEERRSGSSSWTTISEVGSPIGYTARTGDQLRLKGTSQTITFVVDGGPPPGPDGDGDGGFGK